MDGRNQRAVRSKAAIMEVVRTAMCKGIFQPNVATVAHAAGVSVRTVFQHYGDVETMRLNALDEETCRVILLGIIGPEDFQLPLGAGKSIVMAAVLGRAEV